MINPCLDRDNIRRELDRNHMVSIADFLTPAMARHLHDFYANDMPAHWWTIAIHAGESPRYFRDLPQNKQAIAKEYERALQSFNRGQFSYCFRRTMADHFPNCTCVECRFRVFLKSAAMFAFLHSLDIPVHTTGETFASCYLPGSFLSPHHDEVNGRVGFILNLSRNWKPQNGGNLYFLEDDWRTVRRVFTPTFNTLILFDIPADSGVPHFVSHVVVGKRLAVSGWYGDS